MSVKFFISNESDYKRKGDFVIPWELIDKKIKESPEKIVLRDEWDNLLPFQIDDIDPKDPSSKMLVFSTIKPIPANSGYNIKISESGKKDESFKSPERSLLNIEKSANEDYLRLMNSRLAIDLRLVPESLFTDKNDGSGYYSGSATSVLLDGEEFLDPNSKPALWGGGVYQSEKRCMQIDKLYLLNMPWETKVYDQFNLFDKPYHLISESRGPVRNCITIASALTDKYNYFDPAKNTNYQLKCNLYRVISLAKGADYLVEELYVRGTSEDNYFFDLPFIANYFSWINMGLKPTIYQFANNIDWFGVDSCGFFRRGYGFASDSHVTPVAYPYRDFSSDENKCFSWQLQPSKRAKCIHLFIRNQKQNCDSIMGHLWYELIFEKLKIKLKED